MASTIQYTLARPCTYWSPARSSLEGLSFIFEEGAKSKFTYSPKLDLLSKLQTPSGSISAVQGAGVLAAAGVSSSSSGRVLGCIVTWEK